MRLIDIPGLRSRAPVLMDDFREHVIASSAAGRKTLLENWMVEVCDIISERRETVEQLMPENDEVK